MIDILYSLLLILVLCALTFFVILRTRGTSDYDTVELDKNSIEGLLEIIKNEFNDLSRSSLDERGLSPILYERNLKMRTQLMYSLKRCVYGSINDKQYVKDVIYDILNKKYVNEENIDEIINFTNPALLSHQDMFEIILHHYKKRYSEEAFSELVKKYKLDDLKTTKSGGSGYEISSKEILEIFYKESVHLLYQDKLEILSQRIYQKYKGFSVIDELRDMNIDGVSGGVSGIAKDNISNLMNENFMSRVPKNYESVWVFYKGKSIHLSFLSFGTYEELKRVCQNIYRYNNQGMLSKNVGYKVNDMLDGSRVVVVRPDFAESWAFFVRKFNSKHIKLEYLFEDEGSENVIDLIKYLAKGGCITSITGAQASGKTTLLMAMVGHIYETLTLRVQEMAFELNLRKLYPFRNILSFRETMNISGQEGLDLQKKTDGSVLIIGEVATDPVAAWMIQTAQVASAFTIFTHHSKTVKDLILSLRNSLLKCDIFRDERIAEQQVVNVLDFDIHLSRDYSGKRYISRVTEIIPVDEVYELPANYRGMNFEDAAVSFMDTMREYYRRVTEYKSYVEQDILVFEDGKYVLKNKISKKRAEKMKSVMIQEDVERFEDFLDKFDREVQSENAFENLQEARECDIKDTDMQAVEEIEGIENIEEIDDIEEAENVENTEEINPLDETDEEFYDDFLEEDSRSDLNQEGMGSKLNDLMGRYHDNRNRLLNQYDLKENEL